MLNKKGIDAAIKSLSLDSYAPKRVLLCGYAGCGKTTLLHHIWNHFDRTADLKVKFIIADLKIIEWEDFNDPRLLYPVIKRVDKMKTVVDELLNKKNKEKIILIWDCFDDYLVQGAEELKKFSQLLEVAPEKNISIFAASSRVDYAEEYLLSFDDILVGNWLQQGHNHMPNWFQNEMKESELKNLKQGDFIHLRDQKVLRK